MNVLLLKMCNDVVHSVESRSREQTHTNTDMAHSPPRSSFVPASCYARFTLADPMPRLGSDVVGGNGTKPSDVASAHHSHWPNGAQCVHSRRLVRESRTILYDSLVGTVKESYLLQLSVALYTFGSRSAGGGGQY